MNASVPRPHTSKPHHARGATAARLQIVEREYEHGDTRVLVEALYAEQVARYGYADPVDGDSETPFGQIGCRPPTGVFLVGYVGDEPVACGGYRTRIADAAGGASVVEIKKMYTAEELRGFGIGRAILIELERRAEAAGAVQVVVETGVRNAAALALYRRMGYRPIQSYVPGRDPAINRAFRKQLSPAT